MDPWGQEELCTHRLSVRVFVLILIKYICKISPQALDDVNEQTLIPQQISRPPY